MAGNAAALAVAYHSQKFNCAESVFKGLCEAHGLRGDVRSATPFGRGLGGSGCQCGALTGAAMALGLKFGRTAASQSKDVLYEKTKALHDEFKKECGSAAVCCRVLRGESGGRCRDYAEIAARIASRLIEEG